MELKQGDDEEKRMAETRTERASCDQRRKLDYLVCEFSKPRDCTASVALIRERVRERKPCNNSRRHDTTLYITVNVLLCLWVELISGVQVKD